MKQCGWLWGDVRWGNVVGCEMSRQCHVMWWSCHLMWCDPLCCVMSSWCNAMSCDVPSCDEMSSVVKWRDALGWGLPSLWCDVAGCDVTLCGSKWLCDVGNWKMIWSVLQRNTSTAQYYKVPQSTTQFYKVLLRTSQHYKLRQCTTLHYALHSTTKRTTKYYNILQSITYSVLQSMTPYYEILQRYYSIRQSINLFDRRKHMKRPVHCAKQQESPSNFTKVCACHEKWF